MLRDTREGKHIPLCVVIEELKDLKIKCSIANLAKIETGEISCRMDIFAGLCLIYELEPSKVLYK